MNTHTIQKLYNNLVEGKGGKPALSAKTVKNVHGVLHKALKQAVMLGHIGSNPADACNLPRIVQKEIKPLDEDATSTFIKAIQGHRYETVFLVTLFTGMRQGEVLGLTWDCVDLENGTIVINKQIQKLPGGGSVYALVQTKNSRGRAIAPAPMSWSCCVDRSAGRLSGGRGQGSAGRAARWVTWYLRTSWVGT